MFGEVMTITDVDQTLLNVFNALNDRPVVYHKIYSKIVGSTSGGLVLSQLIYWSKAMNHEEFYKSNAELCEELGMGINEFKAAKKLILQTRIFSTEVRGIPATTYYQINLEVLFNLITKFSTQSSPTSWLKINQLEGSEPTNQLAENQPTITEKKQSLIKDNNKPVGCSMASVKSKLRVKPQARFNEKPKPDSKPKETSSDKPVNSTVVVALMEKLKGLAISEALVRNWIKKYGAEYVMEKLDLTLSQARNNPAGFLNKAITQDWRAHMPNEEKKPKQAVEVKYPTDNENLTWYASLSDEEKRKCYEYALTKHAHFGSMLKAEGLDFMSVDFLKSTWFKMMMELIGRAKR